MGEYKTFRFKDVEIGKFKTKNSNHVVSSLKNGNRIMGLTMGEFSLIDLIYSVLKKIGGAEVVCVTWSAGIKDVHNVKWMIDSDLIKKFTLITDHSYKTRQKRYAASIEEIFGIENIRTSRIHAKFCLLWNEKYKITILTSMNLNANKTCEMFEIETSTEVFDFYYEFVRYICDNQEDGFVSDTQTVMKTLDLYFKNETETKIKGWSDL